MQYDLLPQKKATLRIRLSIVLAGLLCAGTPVQAQIAPYYDDFADGVDGILGASGYGDFRIDPV